MPGYVLLKDPQVVQANATKDPNDKPNTVSFFDANHLHVEIECSSLEQALAMANAWNKGRK